MSGLEAGFRRDRRRDAAAEGDPELAERIRREIASTGPIPFARFMERALYEPGHGYYRSADRRPGSEGDFLTAPEAHPIFGWTVARQVDELWRVLGAPDAFVLREHGGGGGALAAAIFDGLARAGSALADRLRYEPVEVEGARIRELEHRVGSSRLVAEADRGRPIVGVVLANEVLDALPVHRVVRRGTALREVMVDWSGDRFVDREGPPSTPALADRLAGEGVELADGQHAEICLQLDRWIEDAAGGLERGALLLVDYGADAGDLYDPGRRPTGTLRAFSRHRLIEDPYARVGRQDLTATVDVTAVTRAAERVGLAPLGRATQAEFLVGAGAQDLLRTVQEDPATTLASYAALRSALMRLLDPAGMGGFQVLGFGRGLPDDVALTGFGFRLPR